LAPAGCGVIATASHAVRRSPVIALTDRAAVLGEIDRARDVALAAYVLPPSVTAHLTAAAGRGARVSLVLAQYPVGATPRERWALADANRSAVEAVRRAGGEADLVSPRDPLHLKAVVVDGRTVFLDDRNWSDAGPQTIVRDDEPDDVAVVQAALARRPAGNARLQTVKPRSLALERAVIASAGSAPLDLESESFGIGPIYDELVLRAAAKAPTRLLVAERELSEAQARAARPGARTPSELQALDRLSAGGIDVRVTPAAEKMALGPSRAWLGSSNATRDWGSTSTQLDWGMAVPPAFIVPLRERFARTWAGAVPYVPSVPARATSSPNSARALASVPAMTSATSSSSTSATTRAVSAM
jgi:hypothetical protein